MYWPVSSYRPFSLRLCLPITDRAILSGENIIHSYLRDCLKSSQDYNHIGGAGMVDWHSPPPV